MLYESGKHVTMKMHMEPNVAGSRNLRKPLSNNLSLKTLIYKVLPRTLQYNDSDVKGKHCPFQGTHTIQQGFCSELLHSPKRLRTYS